MMSVRSDSTLKNGPYISRVVDLAPAAAIAALERCRLELLLRSIMGAQGWAIELPWGRLELADAGVYPEPPRPRHPWPLRRFKGVLRSRRGGYRIGVELELIPWSEERSELCLRPSGRWPPHLLRERPYFRYGSAALDQLAREMIEWDAVFEDDEERVA
jgi:hypothetical protein